MSNTTPQQPWVSRWSPQLPIDLSESPDLPAASMALAVHDIPVFPCTPGGKQPLTSHGFYHATADVAIVRGWWERWPDANIGMPTGVASGVDVVDVDVHARGSGFGAFERARSAGLVGGWGWLVRTPSGGVHAYFLRDAVDDQRSWQVPSQHVDFRGDGGYIIVPPSRVATTDGCSHGYELIAVAQHQVHPVDAGALRRFLEPPRSQPPAGMPAIGTRPDKLAAWVASRPEGSRNHGLFWAACRMADEGHPFNSATNVLGDAAQAAGLPERETMTTIRSAYRIASRLGETPIGRPTAATERAVAM